MADKLPTKQALRAEIAELRARLEEAEDTLRVIRSGHVDALMVLGPAGEQAYTLKGAEEPYRLMVEAMTEGAATFSAEGNILYCNARLAEFLKLPLEQVIGATLAGFVVPQERASFAAQVARSRTAAGRWETALQAADGTIVPVQFSTHPLKVDERDAIVAVVTDLSVMAAAAEERRAAATYARNLIEASLDPLVTIDAEGRITDVNAATVQATGVERDDLVGRDFAEFFTEPEQARSGYREAFAKGLVTDYPLSLRHVSGSVKDVIYNASLYRDPKGEVAGVFAAARDITARKRAEDEVRQLNIELEQRVAQRTASLEAANRELEAFSYSVSHDLRSPLRAIDGFARKLLAGYGGGLDDEGRRLLDVVRDNAQRMGRLIDDLLAFSRMGRRDMEGQSLDMEAIVRSVAAELREAEPGRAIEFAFAPLPRARGDPAMLRQVWANLLGNAVKFSRPRPVAHIEIGGRVEGVEAIYWVRDDGVGFDMRYAGKLFGVFQRLHRQDEFEGTGVGLAIAQRILHRHHGRISGEGRPDAGATFTFVLPLPSDTPSGGQTP